MRHRIYSNLFQCERMRVWRVAISCVTLEIINAHSAYNSWIIILAFFSGKVDRFFFVSHFNLCLVCVTIDSTAEDWSKKTRWMRNRRAEPNKRQIKLKWRKQQIKIKYTYRESESESEDGTHVAYIHTTWVECNNDWKWICASVKLQQYSSFLDADFASRKCLLINKN